MGEGTIRVYVASPYTIGNTAVNVKRQLDAGNDLMDLGFAPFLPLLSHYQEIAHPRPYMDWLNLDFVWLRQCDVLLRLGGESSGAEKEIALARELGIPVVYSIDQLIEVYAKA